MFDTHPLAELKTRMRTIHTMGFFKKFFQKSHSTPEKLSYHEKTVKILFLGKEGTGKTSIIRQLCDHEEFIDKYTPTLYEVYEKNVNVDDFNVRMQFMDLGGSHVFPSMQEVFIKQADIYVLVYATGDLESYEKVNELREQIVSIKQKHTTELPIVVVRTKTDLRNKRTKKEQTRRKAINYWCPLAHDVSSKSGVKINAIMDSLIEESKFIGNETDLGNVKISGRYVYKEEKNVQASEVYHKAPNIFRDHDNSDEKMEKRRRRSLQHQTKKDARVRRSSSFSGIANLRRKMSRRESGASKNELETNLHSVNHISQDSKENYKQSSELLAGSPVSRRLTSEKRFSRILDNENSHSSTGKLSTKTLSADNLLEEVPKISPKDKRNHFKSFGRGKSLNNSAKSCEKLDIEPPSDMPNFYEYLSKRRKSASHSDLSSINNFNSQSRLRSSSDLDDKENKRSFRSRSNTTGNKDIRRKPGRIEIVHTTLKSEAELNGSTSPVEILPRRFNRQMSIEASRRKLSRSRRLSVSADNLSDADEEKLEVPPNHPLLTRRRSISYNDLSLTVTKFRENYYGKNEDETTITFNEDALPVMGKKKGLRKKSILKNILHENTESNGSPKNENLDKRKRSVSFGKQDKKRPSISKKFSIQSNTSVVSGLSTASSGAPSSNMTSRSESPLHEVDELKTEFDEYPHFNNNDLSMIHENADLAGSSDSFSESSPFKMTKRKTSRVNFIRSQSVGVPSSPVLKAKQWMRSLSNEGLLE